MWCDQKSLHFSGGEVSNPAVCSKATVGTQCHYQCSSGYKLTTSNNVIECLPDRSWSSPEPTCQRK